MIRLKPSDLERIVKSKFGYDSIYLGVFLDKNNQKLYPKKFAFWVKDGKGKLMSIDERHFLKP